MMIALPPKMIQFLLKLFERNTEYSYSLKDALKDALEGKEIRSNRVWVKDEFAKFAALILSAVGADSIEDRAGWIIKACGQACSQSKEPSVEAHQQFLDAITYLLQEDAPATLNLNDKFIGSEYTGDEEVMTFHGRDAYPAYLVDGDERYKLTSGSYKKGTYVKMKPGEKILEAEEPRELVTVSADSAKNTAVSHAVSIAEEMGENTLGFTD
jgi:hypothetical protein